MLLPGKSKSMCAPTKRELWWAGKQCPRGGRPWAIQGSGRGGFIGLLPLIISPGGWGPQGIAEAWGGGAACPLPIIKNSARGMESPESLRGLGRGTMCPTPFNI